MDLKRKIRLVVVIALCFQGGSGHLLPQALEDVHAFVQSELNQGRSPGGGHRQQIVSDSPPQGGPSFQTTTTYIGTPVVIQKEVRLDNGGIQKFMDDLNLAGSSSQYILDRAGISPSTSGGGGGEAGQLPRGLLPPSPLIVQQQIVEQASSASTQHHQQVAQVIPANLVGPSTFVSDGEPQAQASTLQNQEQKVEMKQQKEHQPKTMDGWVPIDKEGTRIAKAITAQLQGDEAVVAADDSVSFKNVGYSPKSAGNEVDPSATTVTLDNIIIGTNSGGASKKLIAKYPVYPGSSNSDNNKPSPKVVIHAQNVIIRDTSPDDNDSGNNTGNIKQFQAYSKVPQLNNFLRDQLRIAAMNQLIQSQLQNPILPHPLDEKPFPRPLSLREIAQAARNGQFPSQQIFEPLPSASSLMSFSVPHFVRMSPDARPLPSIHSHSKLPFPGGLGALYRNLIQGGGGSGPPPSEGGSLFDPREPLDYSLLAALSGQRHKTPNLPPSLYKTSSRPDYGDSVGYKFASQQEQVEQEEHQHNNNDGEKQPKVPPIKIISAEPAQDRPPPPPPPHRPATGSLSQISDDLLKQLIIEELDNQNQNQSPLLPSSNPFLSSRPPYRGGRPRRPQPYGSNEHPFAFLGASGPDSAIQESYNEYGSAGPSSRPSGGDIDTTTYIFDGEDSSPYGGGPPGGPPSHHSHHHHSEYESSDSDSDPGIMPINKDTMMKFGKSLFHQALDFSKNHNPLTFIQRVRKLPPVKFELYRMPVGIPEDVLKKLPGTKGGSGDDGGGSYEHSYGHSYGPPPPPHGRHGKKKHYTRKYRY